MSASWVDRIRPILGYVEEAYRNRPGTFALTLTFALPVAGFFGSLIYGAVFSREPINLSYKKEGEQFLLANAEEVSSIDGAWCQSNEYGSERMEIEYASNGNIVLTINGRKKNSPVYVSSFEDSDTFYIGNYSEYRQFNFFERDRSSLIQEDREEFFDLRRWTSC